MTNISISAKLWGSLLSMVFIAGAAVAFAVTRGDGQQLMAAVAVVAALVIIAAWAAYLVRSITEPLSVAITVAERMAAGDLTQHIQTADTTELGQLTTALSHMNGSLSKLVRQVQESADNIESSSSEVSAGTKDLASRTQAASGNLESTASSMEQITATVRQSADAARQANQLASTAADVAQRGGQVVSQVVTTMQDINQSSQKIADIIGVIDSIAFQTNILALNAAVEAARAGEAGRGFAVVASEVRSLAGRSAQAAKEIKELIDASVAKVWNGTQLVQDAGNTMSEIVASVQRVTDVIGEITAASGEQSDGIAQVNVAINQLDQMTQQNATLVRQSSSAAETLQNQARMLSETVSAFKTGGGAAASASHSRSSAAPAARVAPAGTKANTGQRSPASAAVAAPARADSAKRIGATAAPKSTGAVQTLGHDAKSAPAAAKRTASGAAAPAATNRPSEARPAKPSSDEGDWESF
jgi:methyl-accepting chemotaxis protein